MWFWFAEGKLYPITGTCRTNINTEFVCLFVFIVDKHGVPSSSTFMDILPFRPNTNNCCLAWSNTIWVGRIELVWCTCANAWSPTKEVRMTGKPKVNLTKIISSSLSKYRRVYEEDVRTIYTTLLFVFLLLLLLFFKILFTFLGFILLFRADF